MMRADQMLGWAAILRLGVVNAALGAVVALVTFTLNRVMTVELVLPAVVPGALIALHYGVQMLRPRLGFGSDGGGRRTPWILGGLVVLSAGGALAALSVVVMPGHLAAGLALAVLAYAMVGGGVGAVGTSSLALMAARVAPARRAAAATVFWLLMVLGAVLTAGIASHVLHPFSLALLLRLGAAVAGAALLVGAAAILGVEGRVHGITPAAHGDFAAVLGEIWRDPAARRFTIFVFVSMLAYSAQELILEPFAGAVFRLDPAQTAGLTGLHQAGVLAGMLVVGLAGGGRTRSQHWVVGGCAASAACLLGLAASGLAGPGWPLRVNLFGLGLANGAFAVSAIAAMLALAGPKTGHVSRTGTRMGLWGAAQAVAMGLGGVLGTGASDVARMVLGTPEIAYAVVFLFQAALFVVAAWLAARLFRPRGAVAATCDDEAFRVAAT